MSRYSLFQSARATFDANGMAQVIFGPGRAFERWRITNTAISTTSTSTTAFKLYRGTVANPSSLIDISRFNGNGDSSDTITDLPPGEQLLGVWTGGNSGAMATVTVSGDSFR